MEQTQAPLGFDATSLASRPFGDGPWRTASIALDVSGSCNLACTYCAEAATQPQRCAMTEDTLEAAWRLLFPDGRPRAGTSIRLGSGEPLLALPLLHRLQDKIDEAGGSAWEDRPAVHLTTNGTLTNRRVRDWLVRSGWRVKISLDGPKSVHDRWRVRPGGRGTYDRIAESVVDLAERLPDRFGVTAVLCRDADPRQVFDAIAGLGVRRIELVPVAHEDPAVLPTDEDVANYRAFVSDYAAGIADDPDRETATLIRFESRVRRALGFDLQQVPCAAGRSFLGVDPDGTIYPCFRFIGVERFCMGDVAAGPDPAAVGDFCATAGRPYSRRLPCRDCWAAPLCGGPCFAVAEMFGPCDGTPLELHCAYVRADAAAAVWLVAELRRRDPLRLVGFLPPRARELVDAL